MRGFLIVAYLLIGQVGDTPTPTVTPTAAPVCPSGQVDVSLLDPEYLMRCRDCWPPTATPTNAYPIGRQTICRCAIATSAPGVTPTPCVCQDETPTPTPTVTSTPHIATTSAPEFYTVPVGNIAISSSASGWSRSARLDLCGSGKLIALAYDPQVDGSINTTGEYYTGTFIFDEYKKSEKVVPWSSEIEHYLHWFRTSGVPTHNGANEVNEVYLSNLINDLLGRSYYGASDQLKYLSKSDVTTEDVVNVRLGVYQTVSQGGAWQVTLNDVIGVCYGGHVPDQPTPTPTITPTLDTSLMGCNQVEYRNTGQTEISILQGAVFEDLGCFTVLPGINAVLIPNFGNFNGFSVGWPTIRICVKALTLPEIKLMGLTIPIAEIVILPVLAWLLRFFMRM